jgi:hypothetical protein
MPSYSSIIVLLSFSLWFTPSTLLAADAAARKPVAEVLGNAVYEEDLVPPTADAEQKAKFSSADHQAWRQRTREEALRNRVWSVVFRDYAEKRKIEPTPAEIATQISLQKKFIAEDKVRREKQREELMVELKSPGLPEARRKQAQQHLDTLNSLRDHDSRMEQERREPGRGSRSTRTGRSWTGTRRTRVSLSMIRRCRMRSTATSSITSYTPMKRRRSSISRSPTGSGRRRK